MIPALVSVDSKSFRESHTDARESYLSDLVTHGCATETPKGRGGIRTHDGQSPTDLQSVPLVRSGTRPDRFSGSHFSTFCVVLPIVGDFYRGISRIYFRSSWLALVGGKSAFGPTSLSVNDNANGDFCDKGVWDADNIPFIHGKSS